jgi:hypothetical protein
MALSVLVDTLLSLFHMLRMDLQCGLEGFDLSSVAFRELLK